MSEFRCLAENDSCFGYEIYCLECHFDFCCFFCCPCSHLSVWGEGFFSRFGLSRLKTNVI
jgi:hypothetical protein